MKKIEEFALEMSNKKGNQSCKGMVQSQFDNGLYEGIKLGIEFAQRWIPIEEELPKEMDIVLLHFKMDKEDFADYNSTGYLCGNDFVIDFKFKRAKITVTHWRQIEIK